MDEDMSGKEELDTKEEEGSKDGTESDENVDLDESAENGDHNESAENGNHCEENANPVENIDEMDTDQVGNTPERNDPAGNSGENLETNSMASRKDAFGLGISDVISGHDPNTASATLPNGDSHISDPRNDAPETSISNSRKAYNDLAPMKGLPSGPTSEMDIMVSDSLENGRLSDDQQKAEMPQKESFSVQKTEPNPYRNVGDALEEWKERVSVSIDLQADNRETQGALEDNNADEYGYVLEFDEGTAQTLGPATSEQIDPNINSSKLDEDGSAAPRDDVAEMDIDKQSSEECHLQHCGSTLKHKTEEQIQISNFEKPHKERSPEIFDHDDNGPGNLSESLVSVKQSYLNEDICQPSKRSVDNNDLRKAQDPVEMSLDIKNNAASLWRRYELLTTRLLQELAEQLRLVLEPTIASKLQGDYRTGKRINMKKVIPYIASHYRKDKIWLRCTRPNKRDYQVVIAVDDSRSQRVVVEMLL